jgi:hypothetical protein
MLGFCCGRLSDAALVTRIVCPAPAGFTQPWFEHRWSTEAVLAAAPSQVIISTSGLQTAPVPATEHRSSTDQSTRDTQSISVAANLQVRDLLWVRRQGLEPRNPRIKRTLVFMPAYGGRGR